MKPNNKAIEAGYNACTTVSRSIVIDIITAAYAAQFQSEEYYAALIRALRSGLAYNAKNNRAADALEAALAERDALKAELASGHMWIQMRATVFEELAMVRGERDALKATVNAQHKALCSNAARLARVEPSTDPLTNGMTVTMPDGEERRLVVAPVEDEPRHLTTDEQKVFHSALRRSAKIKKPVEDIKLSQIGSEAIYKMKLEVAIDREASEEPCGELCDPWSYIDESDAVITAIRPHIEAAERERWQKMLARIGAGTTQQSGGANE